MGTAYIHKKVDVGFSFDSYELLNSLIDSLGCKDTFSNLTRYPHLYSIHAGEDGKFHVYRRNDPGEKVIDERGDLYLALMDLENLLFPEKKFNK